jgi:hypothetical protein
VDLLVSLAYSAAIEGALNDPLPIGLGLRVPIPDKSHEDIMSRGSHVYAQPSQASLPGSAVVIGHDGLCDFDALPIGKVGSRFKLYSSLLNCFPIDACCDCDPYRFVTIGTMIFTLTLCVILTGTVDSRHEEVFREEGQVWCK